MYITIKEFNDLYRSDKPARVRIWNTDNWHIETESYLSGDTLTDANGTVIFDTLDALDDYYICTISGYDVFTVNLIRKWDL